MDCLCNIRVMVFSQNIYSVLCKNYEWNYTRVDRGFVLWFYYDVPHAKTLGYSGCHYHYSWSNLFSGKETEIKRVLFDVFLQMVINIRMF